MGAVILFDGECNFCSRSVRFIIERDPHGFFRFASLQGERGRKLRLEVGAAPEVDSIVLLSNGRAYMKSDAALRICRQLRGGWRALSLLLIVPRPIRDFFYDILARNRYRWFGRSDSCMLPTEEIRGRFLDEQDNRIEKTAETRHEL